jgi:hypothetical protein
MSRSGSISAASIARGASNEIGWTGAKLAGIEAEPTRTLIGKEKAAL